VRASTRVIQSQSANTKTQFPAATAVTTGAPLKFLVLGKPGISKSRSQPASFLAVKKVLKTAQKMPYS
jgi:hypothetical protein